MKNIYNSSKKPSFNETFYDQTESKYTNTQNRKFSIALNDELPGGQRSTNEILAVLNKPVVLLNFCDICAHNLFKMWK